MLRRLLPSWLLALADPAGPGTAAPGRALPAPMLPDLFTRADRHGVLPAVLANFRATVQRQGLGRVVRGGAAEEGLSAPRIAPALAAAGQMLAGRLAFCLALRAQWAEIRAAMAQASLPVVVLKGPEFADRLYPRPALRTFTDLDLLVPPHASAEAARRIESLGYQCTQPNMKYDRGYGEISFRRGGAGGVVELHTNLVNSPQVREGVSVAFDDLQFAPEVAQVSNLCHQGQSRGLETRSTEFLETERHPTPAALLAVAAVHGAASHGFDRLQILCDVAQAARGAAGELDEDWLASFAARGRAGLALATALYLAGRLLKEPRCRRLRLRLGLTVPVSVRLLLTGGVVLRAHAHIDSFRRQGFREMLKEL